MPSLPISIQFGVRMMRIPRKSSQTEMIKKAEKNQPSGKSSINKPPSVIIDAMPRIPKQANGRATIKYKVRTCIHYFHRHLLCPKNVATALKMLARCPTLLRFLPCIRAFMSSNLPMEIVNTGS